ACLSNRKMRMIRVSIARSLAQMRSRCGPSAKCHQLSASLTPYRRCMRHSVPARYSAEPRPLTEMTPSPSLEEGVDKGCDRGALRKDDQEPEYQQENRQRSEPPPLVEPEEREQLSGDPQTVNESGHESHRPSPRLRLLDHALAEHQDIHPALIERVEGFRRGVHDGLALEVEGRIEEHGHARRLAEGLDELVVARA